MNAHWVCLCSAVALFLFAACASTIVTPIGNFSYEPDLKPVIAFEVGEQPVGIGITEDVLMTDEKVYKGTDKNLKHLDTVAHQFFPEPDKPLHQQKELTLLAMCVYGEARSEPFDGQAGVAYVVLNRVRGSSWYGDTVHEVLLKPYQFNCFDKDDPNYPKLFQPNPQVWKNCFKAAWNVYSELIEDPTLGADHYCRYDVSPPWIHQLRKNKQIGDHVFFSSTPVAAIQQWEMFLSQLPSNSSWIDIAKKALLSETELVRGYVAVE